MSSFIKMSGSVLSGSQDGAGYALGVSEFQMLDGLTAGTVQASKLTVVDSNKDITGYRSVTGSGDLFFANAVLSGDLRLDDDLTVGDDATIGGDLDVTGDLTPGTLTMAEFTVDGSGNTDVDGTLNVEGVPTFQAGAVFSGGITTANAIAGATSVSGSGLFSMSAIDNDGVLNNEGAANITGKLTVAAVSDLDGGIDVNASKFTVSTAGAVAAAGAVSSSAALSGLSLDINSAVSVSSAGAIAGATTIDASGDLTVGSITMAEFTVASNGNTDIDGTLNVEGVPTFQAESVHSAGATFNSAGLSACGAIAGASTIAASGLANLNGGIEVDNGGNKFVVSTAGVVSAAGAISSSVGVAAEGTSTLAGSGGFLHIGNGYDGTGISLGATGILNMKGALQVDSHAAFDGNVDLGNATTDTITATGRFDSDLVPSSDSARDLGTSALQWAEAHIDAGYIDSLAAAVTASAGLHISAKTGPYSLSIADGAGDAIAQAWVTHSDRNLKTNIQELDNNAALNAVMSLQPSTYEKKATGKSEIGFIAQEVAQVVPEICALDANGEGRGIDYSRMSTLLAGALKAQQEQIAQLKEIVAKLQK